MAKKSDKKAEVKQDSVNSVVLTYTDSEYSYITEEAKKKHTTPEELVKDRSMNGKCRRRYKDKLSQIALIDLQTNLNSLQQGIFDGKSGKVLTEKALEIQKGINRLLCAL